MAWQLFGEDNGVNDTLNYLRITEDGNLYFEGIDSVAREYMTTISGSFVYLSAAIDDNTEKILELSGIADTAGDIIFLSAAIDNNTILIEDLTTIVESNTIIVNDVYSTVETNSANWESTYSTVGLNSADWGNHSNYDAEIAFLSAEIDDNSDEIDSVFSTVNTNSADWGTHTDITALTEQVNENTTDITNVTTTVETNSAAWGTGGKDYDAEIAFLSAEIDDVTSTVATNSAQWNEGSDYDAEIVFLSASIDDVTSTVATNSAQWSEATDVTDLSAQVDENTIDIANVTTTVETNSADWGNHSDYDPEIAFLSASIDENTIDIANVTSTVETNSAQWALGTDYDPEIAFLSASIDDNSTDIINVTSTVETNSADWGNHTDVTGLSAAIDANTIDISDVTSTVESNSAEWGNHSDYDAEIVFLSGAIDENTDNLDELSGRFDDLNDATIEPTGFPRDLPLLLGDMSIDNGTRTFTIEPQAGQPNFTFYCKGVKFEKTSADTVVFADTDGLWFVYYDENQTLTASKTPWTFGSGLVFVAIFYWNTTTNKSALGEERHGITMDHDTHEYLHNTAGATYQSGFTPSLTVDGGGADDEDCEMQSISQGQFYDEDIFLQNPEQTEYEIWWKEGTTVWNWDIASSALVKNVALGRPYYNNLNGSTWELLECPNNDFMLMHMFGTNKLSGKIILVMGEGFYGTKAQAREAAQFEIQNITAGDLPTPEFIEIASVIIQCRNIYANSYSAQVVSTDDGEDFVDFRQNEKIGVGASVSDHSNLTGLTNDDHIQYALLDGTRGFNGTVSGITPVLDDDLATKFYIDSIETTLQDQIDGNDTDIISLSSSIDANTIEISDVYSTVETNSADWGTGGKDYDTEIAFLSAEIDDVTTTVATNSADWGASGGSVSGHISFADGNAYTTTTSWGNVGNGYQITVPKTGKYLIQCSYAFLMIGSVAASGSTLKTRFHDGTNQVGTVIGYDTNDRVHQSGTQQFRYTTLHTIADLTKDDVLYLQALGTVLNGSTFYPRVGYTPGYGCVTLVELS